MKLPLILSILALLTVSCGDYTINLPNDYSLVRVNAAEVLISSPAPDRLVIINPNIDKYKILGHFVIGHVSIPHLPPEDTNDSRPGYFILNTKTHKLQQGYTKPIWLDNLRKLGLELEQNLRTPSRFDAN